MKYLKNHEKGFRHKKITIPVRSLLELVTQSRMIINPMYTYHRPWGRNTKTQFIESILVGMPTPDFWCEENNYGELSVLDGSQHLDCLIGFIRGDFSLHGMKLLYELEGHSYSDLPFHYSSAFLGRTEIELRIISYDTDPLLKYEFFKGINRDNYGFPTQSARNYAYDFLPHFLIALRENCKPFLEFDNHERNFSKSSFKMAFDIDETLLSLTSLILLKEQKISEIRGGHPELLDAAMFFLHENRNTLNTLNEQITEVLSEIARDIGHSMQINNFNFFTNPIHRIINAKRNDRIEVSVDGLIAGFIDKLRESHVTTNTLRKPIPQFRKRASNFIIKELFRD